MCLPLLLPHILPHRLEVVVNKLAQTNVAHVAKVAANSRLPKPKLPQMMRKRDCKLKKLN
jgi:hypothetical protein